MRRFSLVKRIRSGDMIPAWYGVAWIDWHSNEAVCLPLVVNVVGAWLRALLVALKHGGRPVRNDPREAYAQGYERGQRAGPTFDLVEHLRRQSEWSAKTFGPIDRPQNFAGVVEHIRKELIEIEGAPHDLTEWIDVVILALDGAWRAGYSPEEIVYRLVWKQAKNEARRWPDWRTTEPGKPIEHVREGGES